MNALVFLYFIVLLMCFSGFPIASSWQLHYGVIHSLFHYYFLWALNNLRCNCFANTQTDSCSRSCVIVHIVYLRCVSQFNEQPFITWPLSHLYAEWSCTTRNSRLTRPLLLRNPLIDRGWRSEFLWCELDWVRISLCNMAPFRTDGRVVPRSDRGAIKTAPSQHNTHRGGFMVFHLLLNVPTDSDAQPLQ